MLCCSMIVMQVLQMFVDFAVLIVVTVCLFGRMSLTQVVFVESRCAPVENMGGTVSVIRSSECWLQYGANYLDL